MTRMGARMPSALQSFTPAPPIARTARFTSNTMRPPTTSVHNPLARPHPFVLGINSMSTTPTLLPDFAQRLAAILAGLAALVARRFLRDPFRAHLILPLWTRISRAARRLNRAFARLAAGLSPRPRAAKPHPNAATPRRAHPLPVRRGWLVAALGPEAAAYATQIESLLAEPAAAAALARSFTARRTLAPIRRMLGLAAPQPRRSRARPQPRPALATTPPKPPQSARPWWLPPPRLRSG